MAECRDCKREVETPARGFPPSRCPVCKVANRRKVRRDAYWADGHQRSKPGPKRDLGNAYDQRTVAGRRAYRLKIKYGIEVADFDRLLASQGIACAICSAPDPGERGWVVDHCHASGRVRGVLCHECNLMLGHAKDEPDTLRAALAYLESATAPTT